MKKFRTLLTSLIVLLCALTTSAHNFEVDGIYYNITSSSDLTVAVTYQGSSYNEYYDEYSGSVIIPEKVTYNSKEYSVTSIGKEAFGFCSGLTSVTIPNSVTSIGTFAFLGCYGLTSVTIPNSVTSIGKCAFYDCYGLTSVTIGNSVTSIGQTAFSGCYGLTSVTIPNSVTSIGQTAFSGCSGLTSVTIPNSVTSIGQTAFLGCYGLTSVTIPNSVTSIGKCAFSGCSGLTTIEVESGNTKYDSRDNCNAIIETNTNTLIAGCMNTIIPNSVTSIGYEAFYKCYGLMSVTIPNSVTSIGYSAFDYCYGLTSVTIPNSVTSIGDNAFRGCSGLTSVTIGNSVTSIGYRAFFGCSGLTSVTIPNSVTSIGRYAFSHCSELVSINIPNSVTSIGESAFRGCSGLTSITIPNSVTSIGSSAFYGCSDLASVDIPNSVTSIGSSAFYGCSGLASVDIPNSVTSIEDWAFSGCSELVSIKVSEDNEVYDSRNGCNAIIETDTNKLVVGCKTTVIPDSVTSIGDYAFQNCSGLTSVTIPNSVTSIGDNAFRDCSGLTSVTIPNSVTSIGEQAFYGCSGELTVNCNIPSASSSEYGVFYGSKFTSVIIGDKVTSIGEGAFYGCSGLTSVTIPNSVTSIGDAAFYGCSGLKSLRFEDGEPTLTFSDNFPNTIDSLYLGRNIAVKSSYFNTGENKLSVMSIGKYVVSLDDKMFYYCNNITKVISYATEPPVAYPLTFTTDIYGKATLSVPGESMEKYRNADVWKKFSKIEEIDNNSDATKQCAAPVITYADGKLQFACETAGAECKYTLTAKDIQTAFITASNNSVDLTACYDITAYAVAEGYKNSEKVTATLYWINGSDVSTNINQTEMRGVMATCSGGIITVSGLTDGETVMFYNANGALLYTGTAQNGTISYAPSTSGVIIVKIGTASIKVVK